MLVDLHALDHQSTRLEALHRAKPAHRDPFFECFTNLELVGRHVRARSAVDDARIFGPETFRSSRGVDRRVASAIDYDATSEERTLAAFDVAKHFERVDDTRGVAGREPDAIGELRSNRGKKSVE